MIDDLSPKSAGGKARADKLSPERRSEIARKAALAKHNPAMPQSTHEGDLRIGDTVIPCAVLEDGRRVLTQSGFMKALGRARQAKGRAYYDGDVNMPAFLTAKNLKDFISGDLAVTSSQINFRTLRGAEAFGYPAELLPKVCEVFLQADDAGKLTHTQKHIAAKVKILIRGLASTGIVALVDEATGYQGVRPMDALQAYIDQILRKELAAWSKRFPDEFYENIYKLKGWIWPGMKKNRFSVVAHYTTDLVYERIGIDVLNELKNRTPKDDNGNRKNKLHQWFTDDVGHPLLAQHLHALLMFQRLAIANGFGWARFLKMVDQTMPKRGSNLELALPSSDPTFSSEQPQPSSRSLPAVSE